LAAHVWAFAPGRAHAQASAPPVITVPAAISAEAASQAAFPIRVTPVDAVPRNSFVRVRGLPPTAALTEGYSIAPGSWAVSLAALPELKIMLPAGTAGRSEILVTLVAIDGSVLAEAKAMLAVSPAGQKSERSLVARDAGPPAAATILRAGEGTERSAQPSQPAAQSMAPQDRERALRLVKKGDEQLAEGNVAAARLFYERAADAGLAQGAMALAGTYDAEELARLGVRGIPPDPKEARRWYERAQQLGASDAQEHLRRVGTN
jgi:TPR repeat protein